MEIVIHCGGTPFNGDTLKTKSLGGSESAAYYMAKELAKQGHSVLVFTNHNEGGAFDGVSYAPAGEITQEFPLGRLFFFYATNTPHDVLIIQRSCAAFMPQYASKVNILWLHDLALFRQKDLFNVQMWNVDAIFTVSEYHKSQVCDVYGINPDIVMPITNGVDLSLYDPDRDYVSVDDGRHLETLESRVDAQSKLEGGELNQVTKAIEHDKIKLIYSSRPERGLENLVGPDGIMERIYKLDKRFHLYVCTYDNVAEHMRPFYEMLWARCEELPNVTQLGNLTKQELADVQRQCSACVYPTTFEEVSCITAMECMAAGALFISSAHAALPETCDGSGAQLIPLKNEQVDVVNFTEAILKIGKSKFSDKQNLNRSAQLAASVGYSWGKAAAMVDAHIEQLFARDRSPTANMQHMINNSDIYCFREYGKKMLDESAEYDAISNAIIQEHAECYDFMKADSWKEHYETYYKYESDRGVNYGPEDVTHTSRFQCVANIIAEAVAASGGGISVLDYGCAHGHYTINLAKRFPGCDFIGVDIAQSNIAIAREWAEKEDITNVVFYQGEITTGELCIETSVDDPVPSATFKKYDIALAAEVVEHVPRPEELVDVLRAITSETGKVIITTPYGPWEAMGYHEHWPWRAHVWHFDRADIRRIYGHFDDFKLITVPSGRDKNQVNIGSYVYSFGPTLCQHMGDLIDIEEKIALMVPRQTLSLCMIVKDGAEDILRCLASVGHTVDEIVIGLDRRTTDDTWRIIDDYCTDAHIPLSIFYIDSPLEIGFDAARNLTIDKAAGQWIMWLDADEILHNGDLINKYLRNNQYSGYALKQHHMAVEPLGCLRTDLPCRIFRNNLGIKFFGVVHEHPELELNEGVGHVTLIGEACIEHSGYPDENARRKRFERNIGLMVRDRNKYPTRQLGKFLWIRDLSQLNGYELSQNGGRVTPIMKDRAIEGIKLWEELLAGDHLRMLLDGMQYYTSLVTMLETGFDFSFVVKGSKLNGGADLSKAQPVTARFLNSQHLAKLMSAITEQEIKDYGSKYF